MKLFAIKLSIIGADGTPEVVVTALHSASARQQFNDAALQYNAAVAQFPANLLAWLFGFKKAQTL